MKNYILEIGQPAEGTELLPIPTWSEIYDVTAVTNMAYEQRAYSKSILRTEGLSPSFWWNFKKSQRLWKQHITAYSDLKHRFASHGINVL